MQSNEFYSSMMIDADSKHHAELILKKCIK
jgi:hypothetical protein